MSLPLGVQLIGAPFQAAKFLRIAPALEADGVASAPVPPTRAGAASMRAGI